MKPEILEKTYAVALAAGKGTRMHSQRPKVLHTLLGEPMLAYVLAALKPLVDSRVVLVAGHKAEMVKAAFPDEQIIIQASQLGTGHALQTAMPFLKQAGAEYALVVNGDAPLLDSQTLKKFIADAGSCDIAFAVSVLDDPGSYGRVVRRDGIPAAIIEAKDYNPEIHGQPTGEINAGIYLLKIAAIEPLLARLSNDNRSGEYYLTDLIELGHKASLTVRAVECGRDTALLGVNTPAELSLMEENLREKVATNLLNKGVCIHAPQLLRASPFARIEPGAEIFCPCEIYGNSIIHSEAVIESCCVIRDSIIASFAHIRPFCHIEKAHVGKGAIVGPFARLRPLAELCENSHVGNFVELKKTRLGPGSKANHLTYLGDTDVGEHVNIGAGTITCNYDGKNKFRTEIGDGSFIGSNTALVAPVALGKNSLVGAGSVVTKDVPEGEMAIARGRQKNLRRVIK